MFISAMRPMGKYSSRKSKINAITLPMLVSIRIGVVKPERLSSWAMAIPSSGCSMITSRIKRSGLASATAFMPSARL